MYLLRGTIRNWKIYRRRRCQRAHQGAMGFKQMMGRNWRETACSTGCFVITIIIICESLACSYHIILTRNLMFRQAGRQSPAPAPPPTEMNKLVQEERCERSSEICITILSRLSNASTTKGEWMCDIAEDQVLDHRNGMWSLLCCCVKHSRSCCRLVKWRVVNIIIGLLLHWIESW